VHNRVKQSFSCKIDGTEVKHTVTKLHWSPDKTDRARSQSLWLRLRAKTGTPGDSRVHAPGLWYETKDHNSVAMYLGVPDDNLRAVLGTTHNDMHAVRTPRYVWHTTLVTFKWPPQSHLMCPLQQHQPHAPYQQQRHTQLVRQVTDSKQNSTSIDYFSI